ncbi:MAG: recombination protein O N-terminal domain-containing protein [Candidatus Pacebacteria bacterium]|nr:recombination protein O N-terminal domain-containing protein [Candidatus Paceibacterota bacterium]
MSYHIHHTTAIVIGITNRGEANRVITLLTRDLGLVRAHAQGIRKQESKLRFGLQQFSHCHCDVILGKESWRLIGVEPLQTSADIILYPELWNIWNRAAMLLLRLIPTDEAHVDLYEGICDAYQFSLEHVATLDLKAFEHFLVLRILAHLGYWSSHDENEEQLLLGKLSKQSFDTQQVSLQTYTRAINEALLASNL